MTTEKQTKSKTQAFESLPITMQEFLTKKGYEKTNIHEALVPHARDKDVNGYPLSSRYKGKIIYHDKETDTILQKVGQSNTAIIHKVKDIKFAFKMEEFHQKGTLYGKDTQIFYKEDKGISYTFNPVKEQIIRSKFKSEQEPTIAKKTSAKTQGKKINKEKSR